MTAINWKSQVSGDWNVAADWSTGAVPTSSDDVTISVGPFPYLVTIGDGPSISVGGMHVLNPVTAAHSLTVNTLQAGLLENAGSLDIAGALTVDSGFVSLNEANQIGSVDVTGGELAFGAAGALGAGTITITGGELLATTSVTLSNPLSLSGIPTIAAAHGTTLNEDTSSFDLDASTLNFGAVGQDGVVVWHGQGMASAVNVVAGTLKAGDAGLNLTLESSLGQGFGNAPMTVDAGATLDLGGLPLTTFLLGAGAVIDSGTATNLTLLGATFSGSISGPLSLVAIDTDIFTGDNTYTGTTTIDAGVLQLGDGGATGSIGGGAISDGGTLIIDRDNALTLGDAGGLHLVGTSVASISGAGSLQQIGAGVTTLNTANSYTGGTTISAGVLAIGAAGALGTGAVSMSGGELLTTTNQTLTNALNFSGTSTIAAAHGTTLDENSSAYTIDQNAIVNIGAPGEDGTVLWHSGPHDSSGGSIDVQAGTLKAADPNLDEITQSGLGLPTTVDAGATIDVAGFNIFFGDLLGGGTVTNSGAAANLMLFNGANFSGTISGPLSVDFEGDASLSGLEDYSGDTTLEGQTGQPVTLANTGTFDMVSNNNIGNQPTSVFVNNGLFEKTGGGGVSDVTSNFINGGVLNVLSGSIEFSDGFTNNGVIHGLLTQSGAVTTVSAAAPSDFNGDSKSDILLQNTSGQASIWDMNGNTFVGGGAVSPNPGPSWTAVGTGDFNGDGHADILWQNSDGQASIWDMNGTSMIGGGAVSPNPGPAWKAIGTGDFNGDGLSDILFQNTMSGQVSIWEMDGNDLIGGGPVSPNPGLAWKAVGTGDFNGDGHSDILFQNTSTGQVSIWEMNGDTLIGGGPVSPNPGLAWKAIGTGDFNDDGHSDILFQNTSTGQVSIWEMNGTKLIGGGPVSPNPGLNWHAIGTGDFNGDGHSDILFQNTSGQASVWEMSGNTLMGGGAVSPNPGASWRAVA